MKSGKNLSMRMLPALLCLVAIFMVACGSNGNGNSSSTTASKAPASQQVYVYPEAGVSDIATFDPGLSTDAPSITAIDMVFTGLVQLNDKLQVVPQEAASYSEGSDGLTWTFHLRSNLKFSDGTPLTSADVAYSIDRALQPAEKSTVGPIYLALIKDSDKLVAGKIKTIIGDSVLTPDPNTVQIITSKKASYFLDALTYSCAYTVEKSLIDKYGNKGFTDHLTEGGGDGPFKVSRYTHNQEIDFVPNPNYYGPHPQLQEVRFPFYKQSDTTYRAYQVGQVDIAAVPTADLNAAKNLPDGQFHLVPQLWINYYTMNYLTKPFDNIDIRQAFELAINKTAINQAVWKVYIPTNHIVPEGMPGYFPGLKGPDGTQSTSGNPTLAKQLLQKGMQQEGWSSVSQIPPITLTYPSGTTETDNEVAALVQTWQTVLGISVKPAPVDFNKLLDDITAATNNPHGLQFWGIAWIADYPDPQDWTTLQFDKGVPNNNMNYGQNNSSDAAQQQATQRLLEQADINPDQTARLAQYNQAEQQLVNDVAWLPMEQVTAAFVLKPYVKGMVFNPQSLTPPNDWGNIYIAAH
jgi:oligopeptide transport system substrate-binding protein